MPKRFILIGAGVFVFVVLCLEYFNMPLNYINCKITNVESIRTTPGLWDSTKNQEFIEYFYPGDTDFFSSSRIFNGDERTWEEMAEAIKAYYQKNIKNVQKWSLGPEESQAVFTMNIIHHMWGKGPYSKTNGEYGGVMINPYVPDSRAFFDSPYRYKSLNRVYPGDFIHAKYGECSDYAMLLYMMLFELGYDVKIVAARDHIYTEVVINNKNYVYDSMYNFVFQGSNASFLNIDKDTKSTYLLFPYRGSHKNDKKIYRSESGQRRYYYLLTRGTVEKSKPFVPMSLNKAQHWHDLNYVPFDAWLAWGAQFSKEKVKWFISDRLFDDARVQLGVYEKLCKYESCEELVSLKQQLL